MIIFETLFWAPVRDPNRRFDSELIRIESGPLDRAHTFFPDPIESR
jgi:hypothetical protein